MAGRGRGGGGGANAEVLQRASQELGVSLGAATTLREPTVLYPSMQIPPFTWHQHDLATVDALRGMEKEIRASSSYLPTLPSAPWKTHGANGTGSSSISTAGSSSKATRAAYEASLRRYELDDRIRQLGDTPLLPAELARFAHVAMPGGVGYGAVLDDSDSEAGEADSTAIASEHEAEDYNDYAANYYDSNDDSD